MSFQWALLALCGPTLAGADNCVSMEDYNDRMEKVRQSCCQGFGQEKNCNSGVPAVCDETCAETFTGFWADCKGFVKTEAKGKSVRLLFEGVNGLCRKTIEDNKVHDTDPVTPGDQFDPNAKLSATVHCHQLLLNTAGKLSSNTGPMDGLWVVGVNGDTSCLYSKDVKTKKNGRLVVDPTKQRECQIMKNKQLLFDTMEKRFGDCTLKCKGVPNYEVCDYSLDTNGDGNVGQGDDLWHGGMFGAILSKDAVYFMVTNNVTAPLVKYAECDEAISGR